MTPPGVTTRRTAASGRGSDRGRTIRHRSRHRDLGRPRRELSFGKGQVTLEKFGQVVLPEGAVRDGEVVDADAVAAAHQAALGTHQVQQQAGRLGVANQKVIVRQVDLPWMQADELKKSLAFQVQDFVPMPVEQAVLDFHPLEELTGDSGAACSARTARRRLPRHGQRQPARPCRRPASPRCMVDLTSFAVLRVARPTPTTSAWVPTVEALIDVGARVTNIVVHRPASRASSASC